MGRSPRDAFYRAASRGNEVQSEDMSDVFSLSVLHYRLFCRSLKHTLCSLRSSTACQGLCASPGENQCAHTGVFYLFFVKGKSWSWICALYKVILLGLLIGTWFSWKSSTGVSGLRIGNSRVGSFPSECPGSGQFAQFLLLLVLGRFWYHRAVGRFWQPMYSFLISASVRGGVELHGAPARVTFISPRAASASRGIAELCCCIKQRRKAFKAFKPEDSFMQKTDRNVNYFTEDLKCKGCIGYQNDTVTRHLIL